MVTPELRIILVFLTSLIAVVFLIPKLARIATRIGLVDQPGLRKVHDRPLPLVGGIAMVISATFSLLLFVPLVGLRGYFLGVAILLLVGFLDDFREIGHREKFMAQIMATSIMFYFSKVSLQSFGDLVGLGSIDVGGNVVVVWLVTVFCVVGVINAINLLDGLDGLAGGFCFFALLTFTVHSSLVGNTPAVLLNLALVGAVLGFLRYNWNTAKVFMGDAGSLCLGFSLAFMALWLTQGENAGVRPVAALLVLAVPIVDTLTVMAKRILRGQSPFRPDKYHLHHIFLRYGVPKEWAVRFILVLSGVFCILSLFGEVYAWPQWLLFAIFMLYVAAYVTSSCYIIRLMRVNRKFLRRKKQQPRLPGKPLMDRLPERVKKLRIFRYIRKNVRHSVAMRMECSGGGDAKKSFPGNVVNISSGGIMAELPQLHELLDNALLKITYELEGEQHSLELPVRHIWLSKKEHTCYHGFEFLAFDGNQENVIFKLLVKPKGVAWSLGKTE